ncbi:hypothetical protein [Cyanobium gracile]|uniref:Uncharacterized protein n=1 Tax=Cyanobium gracile (strain ATCC 27147 / PCC 6307) TaxID=292564 RepID=K9PB66_CYAGP|nr:hypothetical protein [Cyanobium gracile]AFY30345.1 hypothetical protein Cyagr_3269 [Cyanobium gracile PCC 6307]
MVRFLGSGALGLSRFRPSVHFGPPVVLLSCLLASTAAPAGGNHEHQALAELQELRELLVPGFGRGLEIPIGVGGLPLNDPLTGKVVPSTQRLSGFSTPSGKGTIIDGFVIPTGYLPARPGAVPVRGGFRPTTPPAVGRGGTAPTPPTPPTPPVGNGFENVFDGVPGPPILPRMVPAGLLPGRQAPSPDPVIVLTNDPIEETPGPAEDDGVFETALLLPAPEAPSGELPGNGPTVQPDPASDDPDAPASVPGPLPVAGAAMAWRCSRRLRQRLRQAC